MHVRVLPQCAPHRFVERRHVDAHLALIDRRLLVLVLKFDRVFDRDDVVVVVVVEIVDHRRQRRRLARPGRPRDDHQPARTRDQTLENLRHVQLIHRPHLHRNLPQHHRDVAALPKHRHAEPARVAEREAEVAAARFLKFLLAAVRRDALHERLRVGRLQDLGLELLHPAVKPQHGRLAHRDMEIARALLHARREQFIDENRSHSSSLPVRFKPANNTRITRQINPRNRPSVLFNHGRFAGVLCRTQNRGRARSIDRTSAFGNASSLRHSPAYLPRPSAE